MLNVKCWSTRWRSVRSTLDRLGITLDAGMVVRVRGEVQFYKPRGTVDFILSELDTDALLGKVAAERARLIKALVDEDLFDRQRRLPVPVLPLRVGLVASPDTEGFNDFIGGLHGSGMAFDVTVAPTTVQGKGAPTEVAAAIARPAATSPSTSSSWSGAAVPRPTWPPSTTSRWPGPSPPPTSRCGRASATPATSRWPTRWPTAPSSPPPSAGRSWPGWPSTSGGQVEDAGTVAGPDGPGADARGRPAPRHAPAGRGHRSPGPARPPRRLAGHRARTLRGVSRGQLDTHGLRWPPAASPGRRSPAAR